MKIELRLIDTCLCDYFQGCNLPYLQVAVDGKTKIGELRDMLRTEIRSGYVQGDSDDARLLSDDYVKDERRADALTRAAYAAVNRLKMKNGRRIVFPSLEVGDENSESVYAYFALDIEE